MSLVVVRGPAAEPARGRLRAGRHRAADAARGRAADPHRREHGEAPPHRALLRRRVPRRGARHLLSGRVGRERHGGGAREPRRACRRRDPAGTQHPDPVRPLGRPRAAADPGAARDRGRARAPGQDGIAHVARASSSRPARRARCTISRCSRATAPRRSIRTSRSRRSRRGRRDRRVGPEDRAEEVHQGDLQGALQGDVQDGHLDLPELLRRADLRGGRACRRRSSTSTSPARRAGRGHRAVRGRRGGRATARARVRRRPAARGRPRRGRRVPVPRARRRAHVDAGLDREAAARGALGQLRDLQGVRGADQRPGPQAEDAARPVRVPGRHASAGADRRGRAGEGRSCAASRPAR